MHQQYYIINSSPYLAAIMEFVQHHDLHHQIHLNRTRFWIDTHSELFTEFALLFGDHCAPVSIDPTHTQ